VVIFDIENLGVRLAPFALAVWFVMPPDTGCPGQFIGLFGRVVHIHEDGSKTAAVRTTGVIAVIHLLPLGIRGWGVRVDLYGVITAVGATIPVYL
jgi:hypothetical protein